MQQRGADDLFQPLDLLAEGRLSDEQPLRRVRERARVGDRGEVPQVPQLKTCRAALDGLSVSGSRSGVDPVSAGVILPTFIRLSLAAGPGPVSRRRPRAVPGELARMCSSASVRFDDAAAIPLVASRVLVALAGCLTVHGGQCR